MTRKFSPVIDGDANGYSAHVPELPSILMTGRSMDDLAAPAMEAIKMYWESILIERPATLMLPEIKVDLFRLSQASDFPSPMMDSAVAAGMLGQR